MYKPDILVNTKQQSHLIISIGIFYIEDKRILLYRFYFQLKMLFNFLNYFLEWTLTPGHPLMLTNRCQMEVFDFK